MKQLFALIISNLRSYVPLNIFRGGQETVYNRIRDAIIKGLRTMYIEGPTGMGKSFIQATLADAMINGSDIMVLLLVPKITLLSQMKREFVKFAKHLYIGLFGGGHKAHDNQVTVMTYQSFLNMPNKLLKKYSIMFLDEAHKSLGDKTKEKVRQQKHAIIIGFTATPTYSEKKNLKEFLKHEVYRISIPEAVKVGMLSAIQFIIGKVTIEVTGKKKNESSKDYIERLGKDIIRQGGNIAAVRLYKRIFEKRKLRFIMFVASIAQGHDLVRELRVNGVKAEIITGEMKNDEREDLFERFSRNEFQVLVGIETIKEGFDDPGVHGVMFVYPIKSMLALIQGAGRGTRIDELFLNKVAYIVQMMFEGKGQVWYNDALEGMGPFVAPDRLFDDTISSKNKKYDVITEKELGDVEDGIIESVTVNHKEILNLIKNYDVNVFWNSLSIEEKIDIVKKELKKHRITSRSELITYGVQKFRYLEFGTYGRGFSLISKIMDQQFEVLVRQETLISFADKLWPLSEEEKMEPYRKALAKYKINSREKLLQISLRKFKDLDFGPYGKGYAFCSKILPYKLKPMLESKNLLDLADILGWKGINEFEQLDLYRKALAKHKITSRETLIFKVGSSKIVSLDFGPYGKGKKLVSLILNVSVHQIKLETLQEVADVLGWKEISSSEQLDLYRKALAKHKITSRDSLLTMRHDDIKSLDFGIYGKLRSFFSHVLGGIGTHINHDVRIQVADKLWPLTKVRK